MGARAEIITAMSPFRFLIIPLEFWNRLLVLKRRFPWGMVMDRPNCKHCNEPMVRWATPQLTNWMEEWFWVCFNDDCSYFQRGWEWMESHYSSKTSYRYKIEPDSGADGPLPVWSVDALKDGIIEEK